MKALSQSEPEPKLRVLFVGAFQPPTNSEVRGGQLAACSAIIASPLTDHVEWILLESIMESLPPPPLFRRACLALARLFTFIKLISGERIRVVLIFTASGLSLVEKGLMAMLARIYRKRVVLCPRSGYLIAEYRRYWFIRWWLRLIAHHSDIVICQGGRWREFFSSVTELPFARLPIIFNIVGALPDEEVVLPEREIACEAMLMGWVERNKGIFDLVEIVDRFKPEMVGMRFVICGNGSDWDEFIEKIRQRKLENFFELRGWVDGAEKRRALMEADFCLMLSHHEGMPNSLLEAMAAGRPVVATAVGAVSDIIDEGKNGFLCEPGALDEIGFRILDLRRSRELRVKIGENARRSVCELMNSEVIARAWLAALQPCEKQSIHGRKQI